MKYKGQIEGFPEHVVNAMLDEQARQGNKRDVTIFEKDKREAKSYGGFDWNEAILNGSIWSAVIIEHAFHLIPNHQPISKPYPKRMIVADTEEKLVNGSEIRTVLCEYNGKFVAIGYGAESIFATNNISEVISWKFAKDIPEEVVELTLEDISNSKGVGVPPRLIKIVNSNK